MIVHITVVDRDETTVMRDGIQTVPSPRRAAADIAVPDVDISRRGSGFFRKSRKTWKMLITGSSLVAWSVVTVILAVGFSLQGLMAAYGAAVLFLLAFTFWRSGVFTWRRIAARPSRLYARGQRERAEEHYQFARTYAETKFRTDDYRRGQILTMLGDFAAQSARPALGEELYQEGLRVLCRLIEDHPLEYFLCLNNYSVMHVNWKNFDKAQAILELATEIIRPYREEDLGNVGLLPHLIRFNLASVCLFMNDAHAAEGHLGAIDPNSLHWWTGQRKLVADLVTHLRARLCCVRGYFGQALHECSLMSRLPALTLMPRCQALLGLQRYAEAEETALQSLESNKGLAPLHPVNLEPQVVLVECMLGKGDWAKAQVWRDQALEVAKAHDLVGRFFWTEAQERWRLLLEKAGNSALAFAWGLMQKPATPPPAATETAIRDEARD